MISKHDQLLLSDLTWQPTWLLVTYIMLGIVAVAVGMIGNITLQSVLCAGGGFLIALGAEKLVSKRIRRIAKQLHGKHP